MEVKSIDLPAFQRRMAEGEKLEQAGAYQKAIIAYSNVCLDALRFWSKE